MPSRQPDLSVVVATRDRAAGLAVLLEALAAQTLQRERFEIVVVDDGSADGTARLLARAPVERAIRVPAPGGPAAARERGWREASGSLVVFTDDDCRPEPGWLAAVLDAHRAAPGAIVQGRTRPEPAGEGALARPRAYSIRVEGLGPFFETCNVAYPRELLERTGGFDGAITTAGAEDADLAMRALATGSGAVFAPDALVNHAVTEPSLLEALRATPRWRTQVGLLERHPQLRAAFPWRGRIWREAHGRWILAAAGIALSPLDARFLLWLVPYLTYRHGWSPTGLRRSVCELPGRALLDGAEVATLAAESVRRRHLLL